ncbi:MAG: hybrid sensor histidine kinase/response regulator [Candidatus Binataceae bacterium]
MDTFESRFPELLIKYSKTVRSYQQLLHKYTSLLDRHSILLHGRGDLTFIAEWFLAGPSGLALMRDHAITFSNQAFREIEQGGERGWLEAGVDGNDQPERRFRNIRDLFRALSRKLAGSDNAYLEGRFEQADGDRTVEVRLQRAEVEGHVLVGIVNDISERVRMERELSEAREAQFQFERLRAVGMLASGLAHDLNNSLNGMKLRLSLLERTPENLNKHVARLEQMIDDCAAFVRRVQDFARLRQDRPLSSCQITDVVLEAISMVHSEVIEKSTVLGKPIGIVTEIPELPEVLGDPVEIRHIIINLIVNARDAMERGGKIHIKAALAGNFVRISIIDEGTGIPAESLKRIFDPFFTTKGTRGSGLGLSLAYGMMKRLGGDIRAENANGAAEGGAIFTLNFPVAPPKPEPERHKVKMPQSAKGRKILAVDDDVGSLSMIKELFEKSGHHVDAASSGLQALDIVRRGNRYDLVLCDIGMDDMNGWEVARNIHEMAPETAIYMLTGWAHEISEHDPRRQNIVDVLAKPFDIARFEQILSERQ